MKKIEKVTEILEQSKTSLANIQGQLNTARNEVNRLTNFIKQHELLEQRLVGEVNALNEVLREDSPAQEPEDTKSTKK